MAGKRQATSELTHDNWDKEEEPEECGTFTTASEEELKNRKIKKAKRKLTPGIAGDTADGGAPSKSVFSGFSGFGKPAANSSTSSSPFSFLSKITSASNSSTTPASTSGIVSSSTTTTSATPTFSFGSSTVSTSKVNATETAKPSSTFSFGNTASLTTSAGETKTVNTKSKDASSSTEYFKKLSSLNKAVSEWIKTHVDKNPVCILTPIFKDYEKYLKDLEDEKKKEETKIKTTESVPAVIPAQSSTTQNIGTFKFSSTTAVSKTNTAPTSTTAETAPKTNGFTFGFKKSEENSSTTATNSTFSFGLKTTNSEASSSTSTTISTTTPSSGFFASSAAKPFSFTPGATPFSFGNVQPPAATASTTTESTGENEDDEEPPKNEFKQVVEDDAVYSKKCKVFVKKDGNFVDKGVGTLYLKPVESSEKTQLIVRADTNLGNILVNLILSSAIPAQRMGKNNVMMVCLPTPDVEKPTSMLLRVKTSEEADELLENIDKYKK